jgi:RNA polymerase sigma-70 factor (ECF subfamily)
MPESPNMKEAALGQLDSLYGFAIALARDRTEAEDLVQETYLRAVRRLDQFVPGSNLKGWLFTIMRNIWLNQLRHVRSGPQFVDLDPLREEAGSLVSRMDDPFVSYARKVEREEVRSAIEDLPSQYRELIVLRDIEGFSYQEIATILGCPAGTVMSRLGRARERLRRILAQRRAEPPARALRVNE